MRPEVVAFDVIETLCSIEPLRAQLEAARLPGTALELWFAQVLRDGFALAATGDFQPFRAVAAADLAVLMEAHGIVPDRPQIDAILDGFSSLPAHPDAEPALRAVGDAGIRVMAVSNGGAETTQELLASNGLAGAVERVVGIDEVGHWKPRREVYAFVADAAGVVPQAVALVAAHAWDIQGANRAGLTTGFVARKTSFPSAMRQPDVVGRDLCEVVDKLLRQAQG